MKQIILFLFCLTTLGIAQIKISELPELATPDSADRLVIVDFSADTTKQITKYNLLLTVSHGLISIPLLNPIQDNYPFLKTDRAIIIDSVRLATADSAINNVRIWFGTALNSMPDSLFTGAQTVSNNTDGVIVTSFADNTVPKNSWMQITTTGTVGVIQEKLFVIIYYRW